MIRLADGSLAEIGDVVWNYYDGYPVKISETSCSEYSHGPRDGRDCDGCGPHGWYRTMKTDGSPGYGPLLNGERMCSLATARAKGWLAD